MAREASGSIAADSLAPKIESMARDESHVDRVRRLVQHLPELEERDPGWGATEHGAVIELPALDGEASKAMVETLLGGGTLDPATLDRIVTAAEGNPLYAEQLLTMLMDEGQLERRNGEWVPSGEISDLHVPPTIQALIAARLDTLGGGERSVIEPASVVGYLFVAPALSLIALFFLVPVGASFLLSLTDFDIYAVANLANLRVIGVGNYSALLQDPARAQRPRPMARRRHAAARG